MEEEKNILDATEYILLALNTINNYNEFIEYKEEIEKAVYDIRNSLLNIYNKKNTRINYNSTLGLKYNYDINQNNGIYNKSIRNKFKANKKKNKSVLNKKEKINKISDIIIKLNSEDYFFEILTRLFGNDLKEKLTSNEVSDELITAVENSIQEIELLKKKDELKNKKNEEKININNLEEKEEEPRTFPINEIMNDKYKNYKTIKKEKKNNNKLDNIYQEFDFIKNLRQNNYKTLNNNNKKEKPFISTTSIYGNYFDPPLQKGGISKLDDYKK